MGHVLSTVQCTLFVTNFNSEIRALARRGHGFQAQAKPCTSLYKRERRLLLM